MKLAPIMLVVAGILVACASDRVEAQARMGVSFRWCSGSPDFALTGVPKGTARIKLQMIDQDAQSYQHGGGEVAYSGQRTIPCGALNATYRGPSPPSGSHLYIWTVQAIGPDGSTLAQATAQRRFPE